MFMGVGKGMKARAVTLNRSSTMTEKLRRIIRIRDLSKWTGLGRTQNNELIANGELPTPFPLTEGGRAKGVFEDDLIEWQTRRSMANASKGGRAQ
jgi:predicted DNA-binding transcriptional regulator AlpA